MALRAGDREWSYCELNAAVTAIAAQMRAYGVRVGDRVAVVAENDPAAVAAILAAWRAGAWPVPLNARYTASELSGILAHSDPRLVVAAGEGSRRHKSLLGVGSAEWGGFEFDVAIRNPVMPPSPEPPDDGHRVVLLLYTSGTTGAPKGVMLPDRALRYMARLWAFRPVGRGDLVYQALPISHSYGLCSHLFGALHQGCTVQLASRFDPADLARAFGQGVALFQGVPAMFARYLDHLVRNGLSHEAPALKAISTGGAPLDPTLKARVERVFGIELRQAYGLTEAGPTVTVPDSTRQAATALGRPGPDAQVRLVDSETGKDAGDGPAEMWVRTPAVMRGYFRDEAATRQVLTEDGWLKTGDVVRRASDGVLHIAGRAKDVIIRSGFNVYPAEVEAVLLSHPRVAGAAVVGRPLDNSDEAVIAFVQPAHGAQLDVKELHAFATDRLAGYKRPAEIRFLAELPLNLSGKIATGLLREMARS
jgi:acyl-CoA synthetase (AMP-forming)/AMP-acid ligase II